MNHLEYWLPFLIVALVFAATWFWLWKKGQKKCPHKTDWNVRPLCKKHYDRELDFTLFNDKHK